MPQNIPGEQGKQLLEDESDMKGEKVPTGQGEGLEVPTGQKKPVGQVMGKIKPEPGQYCPWGHIEQLTLPTTIL